MSTWDNDDSDPPSCIWCEEDEQKAEGIKVPDHLKLLYFEFTEYFEERDWIPSKSRAYCWEMFALARGVDITEEENQAPES